MNQRDKTVYYGHLDVFIRHDLAEIRGLVVVAPRQSQACEGEDIFYKKFWDRQT